MKNIISIALLFIVCLYPALSSSVSMMIMNDIDKADLPIPTLKLAGTSDLMHLASTAGKWNKEAVWPVAIDFDGDNNPENNRENWHKGIGDRTPTVYLNQILFTENSWCIFQFWYYYPDNTWFNRHEHDWESCFLYYKHSRYDGIYKEGLKYIVLGFHHNFHYYIPNKLSFKYTKYQTMLGDLVMIPHPILHVDGGSHAFRTGNRNLGGHPIDWEVTDPFWDFLKPYPEYKKLAQIPVDQRISELDVPQNGKTIEFSEFRVYSILSSDFEKLMALDDSEETKKAIKTIPDNFSKYYYGEESVFAPGCVECYPKGEYSDCHVAPWLRKEWINPDSIINPAKGSGTKRPSDKCIN